MNLYVVRHGQTDWNIKGLLQGSTDVPLNETGIQQAEQLSKTLEDIDFGLVLCSPLSRAIKTAEIVKADRNIPIIINEKLTERFHGDIEGTSPKDIKKYWDYHANTSDDNIEPVQSFLNRIFSFMDELKEKYKDKDVLVVTHCGVMVAIDCYVNGFRDNYDFLHYQFDNGKYVKYII